MKKFTFLFLCLVLACGIFTTPIFAATASTVAGMQDGWAVDPTNDGVLLTAAKAQEMASGGAKWVRLPFRLGGHTSWDSTVLSAYDQVVANCRNAGLTIIGLVNNESWPGTQRDWVRSNNECSGGTGDNTYIQNYVNNAVLILASRYHVNSQVTYWEIWNEPDVWTSTNPANCPSNPSTIGGSYIYPSNFAWMLRRAYEAFRLNGLTNAKVISGGLLCADFTGTCDDSGRVYLTATYNKGKALAGWDTIKSTYGSYPVDGWGQHMYVVGCCRLDDPGLPSSPPFLGGSALYKFYLDCFYNAAVAADGSSTKKVFVTEWGWNTPSGGMSLADQDYNIGVACDVYNSTAYIGAMTYFTLHDNSAAGLFYGLRLENDSAKPSWSTFCTKNGGTSCSAPPPPPTDTVVRFDDRADGALNGSYGGLDWGTGIWAVGGPWAGIGSKNAFLNSGSTGSATGRISGGAGGTFLLKTLVASGNTRWTITLRDNNGQTFTRTLSKNAAGTLTTGWTLSSLWVDVTSSIGWNGVIDDVTYSR
jgi:hypothetical protein